MHVKYSPFMQKQSPSFWNDKTNQKEYFDWVGSQLGISHLDQWYSRGRYDIVTRGGILDSIFHHRIKYRYRKGVIGYKV
jgi:hypothetical protein